MQRVTGANFKPRNVLIEIPGASQPHVITFGSFRLRVILGILCRPLFVLPETGFPYKRCFFSQKGGFSIVLSFTLRRRYSGIDTLRLAVSSDLTAVAPFEIYCVVNIRVVISLRYCSLAGMRPFAPSSALQERACQCRTQG
jgi:hypothetical protein